MRRRHGNHAVALAAVIGAFAPGAAAQDRPSSGPTLEVHIRTLKHAGGTGMSGWGRNPLVTGTPVAWFLTAGSVNPADMTVCGGGVGETGALGDKLSRNSFVWDVRMLPSKYENGTVTVDLEWARYRTDTPGRPSAEGKATLSLREGDRQPIDFVHGEIGSRGCAEDAAIVEVGTGYAEDRQLAQSILQYDVWLKHQGAGGQTVTKRFTAMGAQGADVAFAFTPLQFQVSQDAPDNAAYDVFTTVQGTIKGRLLPNGRLSVSVDTSRRDGLGPRSGGAGAGWSGNTGRKLLDIAPDEAIEIELPAPRGTSRTSALKGAAASRGAGSAPAPTQAVSTVDGRLVIDHALFFQGQRTSLIVQVKPARQ